MKGLQKTPKRVARGVADRSGVRKRVNPANGGARQGAPLTEFARLITEMVFESCLLEHLPKAQRHRAKVDYALKFGTKLVRRYLPASQPPQMFRPNLSQISRIQ